MSAGSSTRRYLSLWMPFLTADCWRHDPRAHTTTDTAPLVFTQKLRGALRITAGDEQAISMGLHPGLSLVDARARYPTLHVVPFDAERDKAALVHLAELATAFSPTVALSEPNGLTLDITGCVHLHGDEATLVSKLRAALTAAGITACRPAVAPTPDMARALARFARRTPCFVNDATLVRTLPVAALEGDPDNITALKRAGLKTIGDVADRPSVLFTARFSADFTTKLARILGEEDQRLVPLQPPAIFAAEHRCTEPLVSFDMIEHVLADLVETVGQQLQAHDQGGRLFESLFVRSDGQARSIRIETSAPTRTPATLLRLHRDRLDALAEPLDCGFGLDLIRLQVLRSEPCTEAQTTLDARLEQDEQIGHLIDRLGATFGHDRILRLQAGASHLPECAQRLVPAAQASAAPTWAKSETGPRPLFLFGNPHAIDIEAHQDPHGTPRQLRWRRKRHMLTRAEGPERVASAWWAGASPFGTRDYYRVESAEGRRFWIFRASVTANDASSQWFLHGVFA